MKRPRPSHPKRGAAAENGFLVVPAYRYGRGTFLSVNGTSRVTLLLTEKTSLAGSPWPFPGWQVRTSSVPLAAFALKDRLAGGRKLPLSSTTLSSWYGVPGAASLARTTPWALG